MKNTVYCIASTEPQANDILMHLRNLGFSSSEVSVLLKAKDTKNISMKEDAVRDAEKGGLVGGALGALAGLTLFSAPILGPLAVAGPIIAALGGAAVGGVVGGLAGGTGALTRIGIPEHATRRLQQQIGMFWNSDRKSTRLNSSHGSISYAVFCLKKKKITDII